MKRWMAAVVAMLVASPAWAQPPSPAPPPAEEPAPDAAPSPDEPGEEPPPEDTSTTRARSEFLRGAELVGQAQWAEALGAFERSLALRPHPVTRFNIGACERALGRYTKAQRTLSQALADDAAAGGGLLPESLVTEARGYVAEIERLVARVLVTLEPRDARIAVDGRPLAPAPPRDGRPVMLAGVHEPGAGTKVAASPFLLVLSPGKHLITLSRKGFDDVVVHRTFKAGSRSDLPLRLSKLPATISIRADQTESRVMVGGYDVGFAPTIVERPAGTYPVFVEKPGHVPWESTVTLDPGERVNLRASLPIDEPEVWERWWFWSSIGAAIATVVVVSVVATRPEAERPPPDGGGLGWAVDLR